ncbi:hypothetical protein QYE76_020573 [Lolium multiflorum]|uniref:Homeobox domain-containing protein n=1 Tax=Lolium multiflorum TaxID=4521 RepID=A0AAD8R6P1_LOLMU|nr:hypothetical protein QYE76_020573 [Lolium multiflorum]
MGESLEVEELVDTSLSLSLTATAGRRPPVQALLPASPPPENQAVAPGRKRKVPSSTGGVGSTATTRQHRMRGRMVRGGSDVDQRDALGGGTRKKLRLTGEQAALMEKSFRAHNVLSHDEKHDLARRLGLKPRQVEVWFQNRRARTKLKQTEIDCELLRRWCEHLSDDNERLRREVAKARSSSSSAFLPKLTATTTVC